MSTAVKQLKEVVRLQFDVRRAQLNVIEHLVDVCGLSSKKELFNNAIALMKWAVIETQKGRRIASYNVETDEIEMVALPALDIAIESKVVPNERTEKEVEASKRLRRESEALRKPQLGVV